MKIPDFLLCFSILILISVSCKKKKTNESLYNESTSKDLVFYKGADTIYQPHITSPHGTFKLKFNSTAASSFDGDGKLPEGYTFKDGALVVKEVYSGKDLIRLAVMKRDASSSFSKDKWIWAEYAPDGNVEYSVSEKGASCAGCHASGTNRDMVKSFDLH